MTTPTATKAVSQAVKARDSALVADATLVGLRQASVLGNSARSEGTNGGRPIESGSISDPQVGQILRPLHQRPLGVTKYLLPLLSIPDAEFLQGRSEDHVPIQRRIRP